eukprot:1160038-Pelagomonas_calceolata.AAC.5
MMSEGFFIVSKTQLCSLKHTHTPHAPAPHTSLASSLMMSSGLRPKRWERTSKGSMGVYGASFSKCGRRKLVEGAPWGDGQNPRRFEHVARKSLMAGGVNSVMYLGCHPPVNPPILFSGAMIVYQGTLGNEKVHSAKFVVSVARRWEVSVNFPHEQAVTCLPGKVARKWSQHASMLR